VGGVFSPLKGNQGLKSIRINPLKKKSESPPNKTSIQNTGRNAQHLIVRPPPPKAIYVLPTELRRSPTNFTALKIFWVGGLGRNFRDQAHFQGI